MCRFYLLLAGAVEERQGISIPYPSPTPLLTPLGIRCGGAFWLPRLTGIQDSGIRCRFLIPTSIYRLSALCSGLDCSRFSRFRWAYVFRFSLLVEKKTLLEWLGNFVFGLPLTAK